MILPPTERVPLSDVGQLAVLLAPNTLYPPPSPQSNAYWKPAAVSALDGSDGLVRDNVNALPSFTGPLLPNVAVGATFAADQLNDSVTAVCSPSSASTTTVPEPLSEVDRLQDHVPSLLSVTIPLPLCFVIVSVPLPSASVNEPEAESVAPSLPFAPDEFTDPACGANALESQALPRPSLSASA